jgi:uncharacterized delta-60 repeat protein
MSRSRFAALSLLLAPPLAALLAGELAAQDGYGDPTFDTDGVVTVGWATGDGYATAVTLDGEGGLFVGGHAAGEAGDDDFAVTRLRRDGELVVTWGTDGKALVPIDAVPGEGDRLVDLVRLSDGALLLAGFTSVDDLEGLELPALAKLTPDGDLDGSFGDQGIAIPELPWPTTAYGWTGAIHQRDGKPIFFGSCYDCPDNEDSSVPMLLRLTTAGVPDSSFSGDGWEVPTAGAWSGIYPHALALDESDRILVLGSTGLDFSITRLTAAGVVDTSFGGGDGVAPFAMPEGDTAPYTLAVDPVSGEIYVGMSFGFGFYTDFGGVIRLTSAGAVDPGYAGDGIAELVFDDRLWISAIGLQSDGRLAGVGMIASTATGHDNDHFLFRLLPDGTLDDEFHANGVRRVEFGQVPDGNEYATAMTFSGGRLVAVGPVKSGSGAILFGVARTQNALIFTDGFERGSDNAWAATSP